MSVLVVDSVQKGSVLIPKFMNVFYRFTVQMEKHICLIVRYTQNKSDPRVFLEPHVAETRFKFSFTYLYVYGEVAR